MDEGTSAVTKEPAVNQSNQRSYLAMMMLAFFAGPLGLARIYRGDKSVGWGRFWAFVGCVVLGLISAALPPLALLVGLVEIGLGVWGIVDFFLLYGTRVDACVEFIAHKRMVARDDPRAIEQEEVDDSPHAQTDFDESDE